jgi:hypothetical protein
MEHYREAAACDPDNGEVWLALWAQAIRLGDRELERKALHRMHETGFFSASLMNYARWMLRDLPPNTILFTNGDMDTYAPLVVQEVDRYRMDVIILNLPLLNKAWYAERMSSRHKLSLPVRELTAERDAGGEVLTPSRQRVAYLLERAREGRLNRRVAMAITVSDVESQVGEDWQFVLCGPYLHYRQWAESSIDAEMLARSLTNVSVADFAGDFVTEQDRSPVRMAYSVGLRDNFPALALGLVGVYIENGRWEEADSLLAWAREFHREAPGVMNFTGAFDLADQSLEERRK